MICDSHFEVMSRSYDYEQESWGSQQSRPAQLAAIPTCQHDSSRGACVVAS